MTLLVDVAGITSLIAQENALVMQQEMHLESVVLEILTVQESVMAPKYVMPILQVLVVVMLLISIVVDTALVEELITQKTINVVSHQTLIVQIHVMEIVLMMNPTFTMLVIVAYYIKMTVLDFALEHICMTIQHRRPVVIKLRLDAMESAMRTLLEM